MSRERNTHQESKMIERTLTWAGLLCLVWGFAACDSSTAVQEPVSGPGVIEREPEAPLGGAEVAADISGVGADAQWAWADVASQGGAEEPVGPDEEDQGRPPSGPLPEEVPVPTDEEPTEPVSKGACDNQTDEDLLEVQEDLNGVVRKCALDCIGEEACATNCMIEATGISEACSICFAGTISCTVMNCALQCLNAESDKCANCQESNCFEDFESCAGLEPPTP